MTFYQIDRLDGFFATELLFCAMKIAEHLNSSITCSALNVYWTFQNRTTEAWTSWRLAFIILLQQFDIIWLKNIVQISRSDLWSLGLQWNLCDMERSCNRKYLLLCISCLHWNTFRLEFNATINNQNKNYESLIWENIKLIDTFDPWSDSPQKIQKYISEWNSLRRYMKWCRWVITAICLSIIRSLLKIVSHIQMFS